MAEKILEGFAELKVRLDKLKGDLKNGEREFAQSVKRMEQNQPQFGGIANALAKAFAVMGSLELATKGATAAAEALRGNFEEAGELVKQLPFGIGPFAQGLESVLGLFTGINDEIRELNEQLAASEARNRRNETILKAQEDSVKRTIAARRATRDQLERLGVQGFDLERLAARQAFRAAQERALAERSAANELLTPQAAQNEQRRINERLQLAARLRDSTLDEIAQRESAAMATKAEADAKVKAAEQARISREIEAEATRRAQRQLRLERLAAQDAEFRGPVFAGQFAAGQFSGQFTGRNTRRESAVEAEIRSERHLAQLVELFRQEVRKEGVEVGG